MRERVDSRLRLAACLLAVLSYCALAVTEEFTNLVLALPVAAIFLMPFGEFLDRETRWYSRFTSVLSLLFFIGLPILLQSTTLLTTVIALVMYIQLYSLLHVKRPRNYYHILLMSFFLLVATTALTPDAAWGLVFVAFILAGIAFLHLLDVYDGVSKGPARFDVASVSPAAAHETTPGRFRSAVLLGAVACAALGLALVLFFVTPRTEAGILGAVESSVFSTGLTDEVDLSLGGQVQKDTTAVARIVLSGEFAADAGGPELWRVTSLMNYTGKGWTAGELTSPGPVEFAATWRHLFRRGLSSRDGVDREGIETGREIQQEVYLDQPLDSGVPALPFVKVVTPGEGQRVELRWEKSGDYTVGLAAASATGVRLTVVSEDLEFSPGDLRTAPDDYTASMVLRDYHLLLEHDLLPETVALARQVTQNAPTVYDKATAIEAWLSGTDFTYTLDVPDLPGEHPVDLFIHDVRRGHCELHASAMALMLRSLGVPARVATGFRGGDWSEADSAYTLSNDMAHLWVEVFFPSFGWVAFDPSPAAEDSFEFSIAQFQRIYSRFALRLRLFWLRDVVGYRPDIGAGLFRDVTARIFYPLKNDEPAESDPDRVVPAERRSPVAIAAFAVLIAGALLVAVRLGRSGFATSRHLTADQRRAVRLFDRVARTLNEIGIDPHNRSAEELSRQLSTYPASSVGPVLDALNTYNEVRFGTMPLDDRRFRQLKCDVAGVELPASDPRQG